jgi:hypothetical protein
MRHILKLENYKNSNNVIFYYCLDFDDNILYMPTKIHMEQLVDGEWVHTPVSTARFAEVRNDSQNWRILDGNPEKAFAEFRDNGPRGITAFLQDVKKAVSNGKFGPAWYDFVECLTNGSLFAIITARGHEPEGMILGIEYIIDEVLTEEQQFTMYNNLLKFAYLYGKEREYDRIPKGLLSQSKLVQDYIENCDFVGVSAPSRGGSPSNPEKAKEDALMAFKEKIDRFARGNGLKATIGFSDDDIKNVKHIEDLIDNIHNERFPNIVQFTLKGTKNPDEITKKVWKKTQENNSYQNFDGTQASVIPFTKWNSLSQRLYPNSKDAPQDDYHNQMKNFVNQANDLRPKFKKLGKRKKSR